jgi:hypothetical protein
LKDTDADKMGHPAHRIDRSPVAWSSLGGTFAPAQLFKGKAMIFVISVLGILVFRFVFGMIRSLILVSLVLWLLVDESRIHPQFGEMFWQSVTTAAEKVADFGRDQQRRKSSETGFGVGYSIDQDDTAHRRAGSPYDKAGVGYWH